MRDSQDHHADEAHGECMPMRTHIGVRENLMGKNSVEWKERHHAASDHQPNVSGTMNLKVRSGCVGLRNTPICTASNTAHSGMSR